MSLVALITIIFFPPRRTLIVARLKQIEFSQKNLILWIFWKFPPRKSHLSLNKLFANQTKTDEWLAALTFDLHGRKATRTSSPKVLGSTGSRRKLQEAVHRKCRARCAPPLHLHPPPPASFLGIRTKRVGEAAGTQDGEINVSTERQMNEWLVCGTGRSVWKMSWKCHRLFHTGVVARVLFPPQNKWSLPLLLVKFQSYATSAACFSREMLKGGLFLNAYKRFSTWIIIL